MKKILLIGYGKMGSAIVNGWKKNNLNLNIGIVEKDIRILKKIKSDTNITFFNNFENYLKKETKPDFVFIAIKPQQILSIKENLKNLFDEKIVFLSIVAGLSSNWFKKNISSKIKIVRAMPNTPASVLKGVTGVFHSDNILENEILIVKKILNSIGKVVFLKKENLIDVVTSISGSGPAYFFYLTEVLSKLGQELGLTEREAKIFASETFIGSAKLLESSFSHNDVLTLRKNVTSPGGTTEAALKILTDQNFGIKKIIQKGVIAAISRAKELDCV